MDIRKSFCDHLDKRLLGCLRPPHTNSISISRPSSHSVAVMVRMRNNSHTSAHDRPGILSLRFVQDQLVLDIYARSADVYGMIPVWYSPKNEFFNLEDPDSLPAIEEHLEIALMSYVKALTNFRERWGRIANDDEALKQVVYEVKKFTYLEVVQYTPWEIDNIIPAIHVLRRGLERTWDE